MNNRMKGLVLACGIALGGLALAPSASAGVCAQIPPVNADCTEGPGCWDPTPGPTPPPERIPLPVIALKPIWVGGTTYAAVVGAVIDDNIRLTACIPDPRIPGGYFPVTVESSPCLNDSCPYLWVSAKNRLTAETDLAARAISPAGFP
jgi:hypothetical protein